MGLQVEQRQHTAIVTIDRPERLNAIDDATGDALHATVGRVEADPDVWVIVLTGRGDRAFSAGHDLHEPAGPRHSDSGLASTIKRRRVKPSIAAVNGLALGAGLELVLACDLVVAADHATFGLPETRWGLIAGAGGLVRLPRRIPRGIAMEMALTGRPLDAARAAELGLVNRVVARGAALAEAFDLAQQIVANGPFAVRASRQVIEESAELAEADAWRLNARVLAQVLRSPEVAEGQASLRRQAVPPVGRPPSPGRRPAPADGIARSVGPGGCDPPGNRPFHNRAGAANPGTWPPRGHRPPGRSGPVGAGLGRGLKGWRRRPAGPAAPARSGPSSGCGRPRPAAGGA